MRIMTRQEKLSSVASRWRYNYCDEKTGKWFYGEDKRQVYEKLLIAKTKKEIDTAIGNETWTRLICDECGKDVSLLIHLGEEPDYDSSTFYICKKCLEKAVKLMKEE